jgi:hypothetical protein
MHTSFCYFSTFSFSEANFIMFMLPFKNMKKKLSRQICISFYQALFRVSFYGARSLVFQLVCGGMI